MVLTDILENPMKFNDPQVQHLSDIWYRQRFTISLTAKDQIGIAYLRHILGFNGEALKVFLDGQPEAIERVGRIHCGKDGRRDDYTTFWEEVATITGSYTESDLQWLKEQRDFQAVGHLLDQIDPGDVGRSHVILAIHVNAHTYR